MEKHTSKIVLVSGEISGDQYAALLALRLKEIIPDLKIAGIGGQKLKSTGTRIIAENPIPGEFGITSVLRNFATHMKFLKRCEKAIEQENPDLIVFIDNPGFNLALAEKLPDFRKIYYIPPKVWAHNYQRIFLIRNFFESVITIFPFEKKIYEKENIPSYYFGHPVVDLVYETHKFDKLSEKIGIEKTRPVIGMFPGSRTEEIRYILPLLIKAGEKIKKTYKDVNFVVSCADENLYEILKATLEKKKLNWPIWKGSSHTLAKNCLVALTASGTMNLELALLGIPMIVFYRMNTLNYIIARIIVQCKYASPVNIIAGRKIVEEFIQNVDWYRFIKVFSEIFQHSEKRKKQMEILKQLRVNLGQQDVSTKVADFILQKLHENNKRIS